jgi:multiple sugar transport system permease protein
MTRLNSRFGRYIAERGWAHLTLLCGVGIFLFPFVWMLGVSMKTDEEVTSGRLLPTLPIFRAQSPYVRDMPVTPRPQDVSASSWDEVLPMLTQAARLALEKIPLPAGTQSTDAKALRDTAATYLVGELQGKLDVTLWAQPPEKVLAAFVPLLDEPTLSGAMDDCQGRLEFRGLNVRSLDAHIFPLSSGSDIATQWTVESGPGELVAVPGKAACLRYHFKSPDDSPIVLRYDFDFPVDPDQLHKLVLSMKGDDSWHRIDAALDVGTKHWDSDLTSYIAQNRAGSIMFQPPGFDDQTYQPKIWIPLKPVDRPAVVRGTGSYPANLRLTIRPSSTVQAIYGKMQRNYLRAFRSVPLWTYVGNSVLLVALQMVGSLFSAAFVAYAFARLHWPGRSVAFAILLSTMMLPGQVTMIPSFMIWKSLGWYNTLNPLWIGSWFGSAFFIFLMTQNMKTIPRELEEAARIDGLNPLQTWWYIILPLVKPTLAAIAIMVFMGAWNEFMGPLIMLRDQAKFPLSLGLFGMKVDQGADWPLIMAGNMLMTAPVILIFFLFQRYFIEGVTVSGMKG